jgi:hypothetical protein
MHRALRECLSTRSPPAISPADRILRTQFDGVNIKKHQKPSDSRIHGIKGLGFRQFLREMMFFDVFRCRRP